MASRPSKRTLHNSEEPRKSKKRAKKDNRATRPLVPDELHWKPVALPDRLDDAEGFFGLEEIDGVDVFHNHESGEMEYRYNENKKGPRIVLGSESAAVQEGAATTVDSEDDVWGFFDDDPKDIKRVPQEETTTGVDGNENDWEGFDDTENNIEPQEIAETPRVEKKPVRKKKRKMKKSSRERKVDAKRSREDQEASSAGQNAFALLDEETANEDVDMSKWDVLGLSSECLLALSKLGFHKPTAIQLAAIPEIRAGYDVIGKAVTGSGKTLAFGIPILEDFLILSKPALSSKKRLAAARDLPWALILSPTRELAHQLSSHLGALFSHIPSLAPRICTMTGGLSIQKQLRQIETADVVIATPGRLWEVINEGKGLVSWLQKTRYLILDEADRLLSEGHFQELDQILKVLDQVDDNEYENSRRADRSGSSPDGKTLYSRQTLVFSATLHKGLQQKLAGRPKYDAGNFVDDKQSIEYLLERLNFRTEEPKYINLNPTSQMAERLREGIVECAALEKDLYLYALLLHHLGLRTMIFTNSISAVRRLTPFLQTLNLGAQALHSQMIQKARLRSVERFAARKSQHSILVATDVAARGLDIPQVELIVHYHLPRSADMYIHRSGRTARAAESGSSILLCAPNEVAGVRRLIGKVHATSDFKIGKTKNYIRSVDINRRVIDRLKPRVVLAKRIVDSALAKEKKGAEDDWLRTAADQLGVEYDSEEFEKSGATGKGRGRGRERMTRELQKVTKADLSALRAQLKSLLEDRINVGVSEKYLTAGTIDVNALLEQADSGQFLGTLDSINMDK